MYSAVPPQGMNSEQIDVILPDLSSENLLVDPFLLARAKHSCVENDKVCISSKPFGVYDIPGLEFQASKVSEK